MASFETLPYVCPDVFFGGKRVAMRNVSSGNIYYYEEDMLGSSRTMVQAGQTSVCYDADFYPFGGERDITSTCTQNYKFEGKERDTETGNDDFGARYYTSRLGRWLSADWSAVPAPVPYANLTNPQTLNLYAMVSDNPETFDDLDGHGCSLSLFTLETSCSGTVDFHDPPGEGFTAKPNTGDDQPASDSQQGEAAQLSDEQNQAQQQVSQAGQDFIKGYESLSLTVYDASKGKVKGGDWTIGYGHKTTKNAGAITLPEAEALFQGDVARMASHVSADLNVPVSQNQFDALVSLRFNAGANAITPPVSDLNRTGHATMGDFTNHYITGGGVPMRGLELRRAAEWRIFSEGVYDASH